MLIVSSSLVMSFVVLRSADDPSNVRLLLVYPFLFLIFLAAAGLVAFMRVGEIPVPLSSMLMYNLLTSTRSLDIFVGTLADLDRFTASFLFLRPFFLAARSTYV